MAPGQARAPRGAAPSRFDLLHALAQEGWLFPQGMGLGLTVVCDIAQAHGWRLEMESTPGQGIRFTIWLPLGCG